MKNNHLESVVPVQQCTGKENGYEYVDLGLSVKWATCNVGATTPEGYGDYFAWGETSPKNGYSWSTLKYCNSENDWDNFKFSKYVTESQNGTIDNRTVLELSDDAAYANWGGGWRMPTLAEFDELSNSNNCKWIRTTLNGVKGYKVISKKPGYKGNYIFLPSAGYRRGTGLYFADSRNYYWSSSFGENFSDRALFFYLYSAGRGVRNSDRCFGYSVRPVYGEKIDVIGVFLNKTIATLELGGTEALAATITPSNAAEKGVIWSSSDDDVATVDQNGNVTAFKAGNATITVKTSDGGYTATCNVTVQIPSTGGHEYVDLGLSVKWATCNVGATTPEGYGKYFAWGEIQSKTNYDWSTLKYRTSGNVWNNLKFSKYVTEGQNGTIDNRTVLELSDDAARANWGGKWRMPTQAEFRELIDNCTWTWTTQNGVNGYKVVSRVSGYEGRFIFLPAAGYRNDTGLYSTGSGGDYWSSSLDTDNPRDAWRLYFGSGGHSTYGDSRHCGLSVRPVYGGMINVTDVSLNKKIAILDVGDTKALTATITPSTAAEKGVTWSSSDDDVATVDQNGNVTAFKAGSATITVKTIDRGYTATCNVTIRYENSHKFVQLGLSVKWATCNIGAATPEGYGDCFGWGETSPKNDYEHSTLKYSTSGESSINHKFSKYVTKSRYGTVDNRTVLELSDDAAHANWGDGWRMPTQAEFDELSNSDNCKWIWTTLNGVKGYKVVSKIPGYKGNYIFLPAAGYRSNTDLYDTDSYGYYWSSSLRTGYPGRAWGLRFYSGSHYTYNNYRNYGQSVRPVRP